MKPINNTASDLFQKLRARFSPVTLGNDNGESTGDPSDSRFFNFVYNEEMKGELVPIGPVTISLIDGRSMKVYYSDQILEKITNRAEWYALLRELRSFAKRNLLTFDARDIAKQQLDARDFQWLGKNDGQLSVDDIKVTESVMFGSKRKSYQVLETVKLIVQHTKSVDEAIQGARSRSIESIYLERQDGERYKFPFNYLTGARAMARHVHEGGTPYDDNGKKILGFIKEMKDLGQFARMTRNHAMENGDASSIREKVLEKYHAMKKSVNRIATSEAAYHDFIKSTDSIQEGDSASLDTLKERFTRKVWNNKMEELLPSVSRALEPTDTTPTDTTTPEPESDHLVLKYDMDADRIASSIEPSDMDSTVAKIMSDIADRAVDITTANMAKDVATQLRSHSLKELDPDLATQAVELAVTYIGDIAKIFKDDEYCNVVRQKDEVADKGAAMEAFSESDSFSLWADSLTESYTESEEHAESIISRLKGVPSSMSNVYSIIGKYKNYVPDEVFNEDEVAQIIMDRYGINEGIPGASGATPAPSAQSAPKALSAQDRTNIAKQARDVSKMTKAAGVNANPSQLAQSLAADASGKAAPKAANLAKAGLGDKIMKAAASDPKKAAALTAMMKKIGESEQLEEKQLVMTNSDEDHSESEVDGEIKKPVEPPKVRTAVTDENPEDDDNVMETLIKLAGIKK